jgi:hypothetical protein
MIALIIALTCITELVVGPFTETMDQAITSACDMETSGQGKYAYRYLRTNGSDLMTTACCNVTGLDSFKKDTTRFKKGGTSTSAICCVNMGTKNPSGSKLECCNNGIGSGGSKCMARSKPVTAIADGFRCKDPRKPFHFSYKLLGSNPRINISGDGCCDREQVNMIQLSSHCCVTSNSPCMKGSSDSAPCCGPNSGEICQIANYQTSNAPAGGESKLLREFLCQDNRAGLWNVTQDLNEDRIFLGSYIFPVKCCGEKTKSSFMMKKKLARGCCPELSDRFQNNSVIGSKCCVFSITRTERAESCNRGVACCHADSDCKQNSAGYGCLEDGDIEAGPVGLGQCVSGSG